MKLAKIINDKINRCFTLFIIVGIIVISMIFTFSIIQGTGNNFNFFSSYNYMSFYYTLFILVLLSKMVVNYYNTYFLIRMKKSIRRYVYLDMIIITLMTICFFLLVITPISIYTSSDVGWKIMLSWIVKLETFIASTIALYTFILYKTKNNVIGVTLVIVINVGYYIAYLNSTFIVLNDMIVFYGFYVLIFFVSILGLEIIFKKIQGGNDEIINY